MDNLESAYLCLKNNDIKVCSAFSAFISDVTTETSDDNVGVIVGSLAGVVVLVAAVVAVVLIYKKMSANPLSNNMYAYFFFK